MGGGFRPDLIENGAPRRALAAPSLKEAFSPASTEEARPRVLLFTTQRWPTAALLADALATSGFKVGALCPPGHPLRAVGQLAHVLAYRHPMRFSLLAKAIAAMRPGLIVPCDDDAVGVIHAYHAHLRAQPDAGPAIEVIEKSLGDPRHYELLRAKSAFIRFAADHGIPTPATTVIASRADLAAALATASFPLVLKADGWSGGRGTRVAHDAGEALEAFDALTRSRRWGAAVKDALREGSVLPVYRRLRSEGQVVTLQAFAPGRPVNRAVICSQGKVLAGRTFEAVETMPNNGNATVVRPRQIAEIDAAVERCVALLGLSGVVGFDFMYDEVAGAAYLLEVNPRATSACYTAPKGEPNLTGALFAAVTGRPVPQRRSSDANPPPLIALFPQEFERDPHSAYLRNAESQQPLDRPELIEACLAAAARRTLYARLVEAIKRGRPSKTG
jgi:hypothetical protein